MCFFDDSVVISGLSAFSSDRKLFSTGLMSNFKTKEYFGLEDYSIPTDFEFQCLHGADLFTVNFKPIQTASNYSTFVFYSKSSGRAERRLHSWLPNIESRLEIHSAIDKLVLTG